MPNQYTPEKRTVGNLLSITNPPILVPDWQRSYSWTTTEVETFWNDLLHFHSLYPDQNIADQEYFLGSIVIVNNINSHLLLDGQQRLATAAILLSVIRDYLAQFNTDAAARTQARYLGDFDDATNEYSYKITMNEYDRDFFKHAILESKGPSYIEPEPKLESHRLILKARRLFEGVFQKRSDELENPASLHHWALRIQDVLTNHISVVAIFSQDEDNAASVFETLNDRGIGLSTPDLLRNLLLRRTPPAMKDEVVDLWGEILEVENDAELRTFLRHYWVSNHGDVKSQSLYREIKAAVIDQNLESRHLSRNIRDASVIYREIVSAHDEDEDRANLLTDIKDMGASLLYPAILSAYQLEDQTFVTSLLKAFIVTYVRHSVIGKLENSRLEDTLYRIARELRIDHDVASAIETLKGFAPSDQTFKQAFCEASIVRTATVRYILNKLELDMRTTEELDVAPPSRVHVEHIYPQTPQPGQRVLNHSELINRIGNLTLLSRRLNTSIRNSVFSDKKPFYAQSELLLTRGLLSHDEWNEGIINQRQIMLSTRVAMIWAFP